MIDHRVYFIIGSIEISQFDRFLNYNLKTFKNLKKNLFLIRSIQPKIWLSYPTVASCWRPITKFRSIKERWLFSAPKLKNLGNLYREQAEKIVNGSMGYMVGAVVVVILEVGPLRRAEMRKEKIMGTGKSQPIRYVHVG